MRPEGVTAARVTYADSRPTVEMCEFRPVGEGSTEAILAELVKEKLIGPARTVSVIEEAAFTLLLIEAPQVNASELKAAVRWRIKDLLDFHIDDAVIDVFDIPGQQERGRPKMMYVVAARIAAVRDHINLLEGHGVNLTTIDIPELCQRNVAALLPEDENGVALLHLDRHDGLLTLTRNKVLYLSRTLDVGFAHLTADAPSFTLGEEPAMSPQQERRLDGIILEVQRSLDYYESHFSLPTVSALVMAPTEQPIPGMMSYIAGNLGIPVRLLAASDLIESKVALTDTLLAQSLPALGAALRREEKAL